MRRLRHAVTGLTLLTFFGVSGAVAQTPGSEGGGASQDGATASGGSSAQAEAELKKLGEERKSLVDEDIESLSGDQMLKRAHEKIDQSKSMFDQTGGMLEKARSEEKDLAKLNCINEKRTAIEGYLKVAEEHYVSLKEAVNSGDNEAASHHYTLVSVAHQKVQEYLEEAKLCAGEVERYAEGTKVKMDRDRELPGDPEYLSEEPTALETLPELTPFQ